MSGWYVSRRVGGGGHLEPKRPVRRQVWPLTQFSKLPFLKNHQSALRANQRRLFGENIVLFRFSQQFPCLGLGLLKVI